MMRRVFARYTPQRFDADCAAANNGTLKIPADHMVRLRQEIAASTFADYTRLASLATASTICVTHATCGAFAAVPIQPLYEYIGGPATLIVYATILYCGISSVVNSGRDANILSAGSVLNNSAASMTMHDAQTIATFARPTLADIRTVAYESNDVDEITAVAEYAQRALDIDGKLVVMSGLTALSLIASVATWLATGELSIGWVTLAAVIGIPVFRYCAKRGMIASPGSELIAEHGKLVLYTEVMNDRMSTPR